MRDRTQATPFGNSAVYALLAAEAAEQSTWPREPVTPFRALTGDPRNEDPPAADPPPPTIDWESDDNPYKGRYTETQRSYTQGQQRLSELEKYEQDPQAFLTLGQQKGWIEIDDPNAGGSGETEYVDPQYAELVQQNRTQAQRLEVLEARAQQEARAAGEQMFRDDLDSWAQQDGVKLSKSDQNAILHLLLQSDDPTNDDTAKAIYQAHVADKKAEREALEAEIRESLKRPRIPTPPADGSAATGTKPFHEMTREERDAWVYARSLGG